MLTPAAKIVVQTSSHPSSPLLLATTVLDDDPESLAAPALLEPLSGPRFGALRSSVPPLACSTRRSRPDPAGEGGRAGCGWLVRQAGRRRARPELTL